MRTMLGLLTSGESNASGVTQLDKMFQPVSGLELVWILVPFEVYTEKRILQKPVTEILVKYVTDRVHQIAHYGEGFC